MKRPELRLIGALLLLCSAAVSGQDAAVEGDAPDLENWYRIELLVFARRSPEALSAEAFEPLPSLSYPGDYRFLIDTELADERLAAFNAYRSSFDDRGMQRLILPSPPSGLDLLSRPDMLLAPRDANDPPPTNQSAIDSGPTDSGAAGPASAEPLANEAASPISDAETAAPASDSVASAGAGPPGEMAVTAEDEPVADPVDPDAPLLAAPYQMLPFDTLEFRYQSAMLRRRGSEVLFHGAWWAPLGDRDTMLPIVLDRSGDPDAQTWPKLQGSVLFYLSRYLHLELDLWLNTEGDYLPAEWQIETPPLTMQSYDTANLLGQSVDPAAPAPRLESLFPSGPGELEPPRPDGAIAGEPLSISVNSEAIDDDRYPYRHAITHRQNRRMRGGELHYLDHPVLGVVVKIQPVETGEEEEEDITPWLPADWLPFMERHQLPITRQLVPAEESGED